VQGFQLDTKKNNKIEFKSGIFDTNKYRCYA